MPKTKDAFAFREFYNQCLNVEVKSQQDVRKINHYYEEFLSKGFLFKGNHQTTLDKTRYLFHKYLYESLRAQYLLDLIERHKKRLEKLNINVQFEKFFKIDGKENSLRHEKIWKLYEKVSFHLKEAAINFAELATFYKTSLKKVFARDVGERLKIARRKAGISQTVLARQFNISQEIYSKYERGDYEMPLFLIVELSNFLNVSLDWLLCKAPMKEQDNF